tara:strand:- start:30 stop:686 length:657 start_codon:yes stop_codon:yes gene_type:complete
MFEISENLVIDVEIFQNSKIFIIDNFYKNPDVIFKYLFETPAPLFKNEDYPSYNGILFEDRRLKKYDPRLNPVVDFLSLIVSEKPMEYKITTNQARFYKNDFNNYKNHIWWPHLDEGYNGIVYFNKNDTECGTNLYSQITDRGEIDDYHNIPEHSAPWRREEKYEKLKTLIPKFNRLILFDGYKFPHGMNIVNDAYFSEEYRCNQIFFFKRNTLDELK